MVERKLYNQKKVVFLIWHTEIEKRKSLLVTGLFYREKLGQKFSVFTHVQQEVVSLSKQHQSSFNFHKIVKQQQQLSELKEANERFVKKSLISF